MKQRNKWCHLLYRSNLIYAGISWPLSSQKGNFVVVINDKISLRMIQKDFESITIEDLTELITNKVQEGKTIEYKSVLNVEKDAEKKEFLYDVSSFANASGGDIIFGIAEGSEKGFPGSLSPLDKNFDETSRKIESLIRDCISPRILNIKVRQIPVSDGKYILLIRIPKSFNAPHQVTFQGVDRFYSRSNNGKYVLDVFEIRNAFIQSSQIAERIRTFIKQRIANVIANEGPVKLEENPKIILHILPLNSIDTAENMVSNQTLKGFTLFPLGAGGYNYRFNLEGVLNFSSYPGSKSNQAYVQLYRNGIIESVNGDLIKEYDGKKLIYVGRDFSVEEKIIGFVTEALKILNKIDVQPPIYLFLHLCGVKGYGIGSSRLRQSVFGDRGIDRDILQLPEVVIQNYPDNVAFYLKEWFETIWNACGYEKCYSYDDNGNFTAF